MLRIDRDQDLSRRRHAHRQRLHARAVGREQDLRDRRPGLPRRALHSAREAGADRAGPPSRPACNSPRTASATARCTPCSTPTKRSTGQTPIAATRPCITHSNFMSREAIDQAARLGVVVDIQPAWLYLDTRTLVAQFGYDRLRYFQPLAEPVRGRGDRRRRLRPHAEDRLAAVDQPLQSVPGNVGRHHPPGQGLRGPAPSRGGPDPRTGHPLLHDQQRLRSCSSRTRSARSKQGKLADFVVLDRDILTCPEDEIRAIQPLATYLSGKAVFERK